jgi:hypothetical protein
MYINSHVHSKVLRQLSSDWSLSVCDQNSSVASFYMDKYKNYENDSKLTIIRVNLKLPAWSTYIDDYIPHQ